MKTALETLIQKWESNSPEGTPYALIWDVFIKDAKEALKQERKQIIDAVNNGCGSICNIDPLRDGERYFKENFIDDDQCQ